MIPVYNCWGYLKESLESVLAHNIGPENMQIVVVDDYSTDGDVEALVRSIGGQRITYFQQPKNQGSLRNFETCLNLAIGHWVHILHGDDRVMPGFYHEIEKLFHQHTQAGAAFTNYALLTSDSKLLNEGASIVNQPPGILKDFVVQNAKKLLLQPPAIVVKRSVYEQLGGFYAAHYGEDWEMWTRIGAYFPIAYSPLCLANYRYFTDNSITQQAILSGQNVHDIIKVIDIMQAYIPIAERANVKKLARRDYALYCVNIANSIYKTNRTAALVQARGALRLSKDAEVYNRIIKYLLINMLTSKKIRRILKHLFKNPSDFLP